MTATNMCSNFVGFGSSHPLTLFSNSVRQNVAQRGQKAMDSRGKNYQVVHWNLDKSTQRKRFNSAALYA